MSRLNVLHEIAQETLVPSDLSGQGDRWLWDRTLRILQNVEHICRLPALAEQAISIDRYCLVAAAYFADSGLQYSLEGQKGVRQGLSGEVMNADRCIYSTRMVSEKLDGITTETRIDKINEIIVDSFNRMTDSIEAMVLSDARGLEDLGAAGLLGIFRRQLIDGKGVSGILKSWKRKTEYGYWHARLTESFRFDAVRELAEKRFSAAEEFMNQLAAERACSDLSDCLLPIPEPL